MKRTCARLLAVFCAVTVIFGVASADVPLVLSHQGRLLDGSDNPVTGTRDITFRIFESATGGNPLWSETHFDVPISDGLYNVILGSTITISGDLIVTGGSFGTERFLEIEVENDGPMSPRSRMVASPYSVAASRVSGDVHTLPGELSVSGFGGSTTGTIRASQNPGVEGTEIILVDGSGSTTGTIRAASSSGAQVHLSGLSGSTTGTIRMTANGDSAISVSGMDLDGDGVVDVGTSTQTRESRSILKSFYETGDKPTQARFVNQYGETDLELTALEADEVHTATVSADSAGSELRVKHLPLGGGPSGSTTGTIRASSSSGAQVDLSSLSGSTTGTIRMAAHPDSAVSLIEHDSDNDGVAELTARNFVDALIVESVTSSRFGNGPRQTTSQDGSFSHARSRVVTDLDDDGIPDVACVNLTDSSHAERTLSMDNDDDGFADHEILDHVDAQLASTRLKGMSGSTTGTIRMAATGDSSNLECAHDSNNNGNNENWMFGGATVDGSTIVVGSDSDDDGVADHSVIDNADAHHTHRHMSSYGGSTTGTIRMSTTTDSVTTSSSVGDGSSSSTSSMRTRINELETKLQSVGLLSQSSATTTTTPNSVTRSLDVDINRDGNFDARVTVGVRDVFGNPVGSMYIDTDSDDDGVVDHSIRSVCDDSSAVFTVGDTACVDCVSISQRAGVMGSIIVKNGGSTRTTLGVENLVLTNTLLGTIDTGIIITNDKRFGIGVSDPVYPLHHESGAHLTAGGNWTNASDASLKENFVEVDGADLLNRIDRLSISQWNYKKEDESITHIGPTAQDFKATFGVGDDDKTISTIDPSGIALAAIKELNRKNRELSRQNDELKKELEDLKAKVEALISR